MCVSLPTHAVCGRRGGASPHSTNTPTVIHVRHVHLEVCQGPEANLAGCRGYPTSHLATPPHCRQATESFPKKEAAPEREGGWAHWPSKWPCSIYREEAAIRPPVMRTFTRTHTHTHACTRTHARTHACKHTRTRTCIHTHMHKHIYMHTRTHTYTHCLRIKRASGLSGPAGQEAAACMLGVECLQPL